MQEARTRSRGSKPRLPGSCRIHPILTNYSKFAFGCQGVFLFSQIRFPPRIVISVV